MQSKFSATIGNFDGIHKGHMRLISHVLTYAQKNNIKSKVITFNPYPFEYFKRDKKRILANQDKIDLLNDLNIDSIDSIKFDEVFRSLTSKEFFQKYILNAEVEYLIVGEDFKFGIDRSGDISTLKDLCAKNNIVLDIAEDVLYKEEKISSTLIRSHLEKGNFSHVTELLQRPYQITGKVISGKNIGKRISTPTANIEIDNVDFCFSGVFLCKTKINEKDYFCIVNFGPKPTFNDYRQSLEAHILDFDKNIYDEILSIEFLCKIRDQIKFDSIDDLKNQIKKDREKAESLLKNYE